MRHSKCTRTLTSGKKGGVVKRKGGILGLIDSNVLLFYENMFRLRGEGGNEKEERI